MSLASLTLHTVSTAVLGYGLANSIFSSLPVDEWIRTQYGGHFQYLTILGVLVAFSSFVVGLAVDISGSRRLRSTKRLLSMIAMPMEAIIASIYWSLLIFAPSLILIPESTITSDPNVLSATVVNATTFGADSIPPPPLPVDLSLHAAPGLALILDFLLFEKKFSPEAGDLAGPIVCITTSLYASWAEMCAEKNGAFPYPFLTLSNFEARVGIYAGATLIAYWSFCVLNALHR